MTADGSATVIQGGRAKAFRPLPEADRRAALDAGLEAYRRGDFFEAHELLEPAWMGTDDARERNLHQGLIKLAAAYVHAIRRNPDGMRKNLEGARDRLAEAAAGDRPTTVGADVDAGGLVDAIDVRLAMLAAGDFPPAPPAVDGRP